MKIAIALSGNLRTFFMPTREDPSRRVCDTFLENIVKPNNADLYFYTDVSDFFHEGSQYFSADRKIEILNGDAFRLYPQLRFISDSLAREIITRELEPFSPWLKSCVIENAYDCSQDPKFQYLNSLNLGGSSPTLLVQQFRKLQKNYQQIPTKYDLLVKWRFDIYCPTPLMFDNFSFVSTDVYVAGIYNPVIYDWHAFGRPEAMERIFNLFDHLGEFAQEGRKYLCEVCHQASPSPSCCQPSLPEITLAPEYHLYRLLQGLRLQNSGYPGHPYRYQLDNQQVPLHQILSSNPGATLVNHTSTNQTEISYL